jgi:hypothetical protein
MNYKVIDTTPIDGLCRVMANNKYGIINQNNDLICDIDCDAIEFPTIYANTTHIMVKRNGKWSSIDKYGKNRISLQFDYYSDFFSTNPNYAVVRINSQSYIIDIYGNTITGECFCGMRIEDIELFGEKFAFFEAEETLIIAYDIELRRCPAFWGKIYLSDIWVTAALDKKKDYDGNLLYRTATKEYTIDKKGSILKIEPLPFKLKMLGLALKYIVSPIVKQEMKRERRG